jgi:hypothetical protein
MKVIRTSEKAEKVAAEKNRKREKRGKTREKKRDKAAERKHKKQKKKKLDRTHHYVSVRKFGSLQKNISFIMETHFLGFGLPSYL